MGFYSIVSILALKRASDCVMNLSQAAIEHDGILCVTSPENKGLSHRARCSGEGNEKDNIAAEKVYEAAAAKGHRPCKLSLQ